jgi:heme-degrading monooxygenase HmoA
MLGGCFSKDDNSKEPRYLVTTFWDKLENHDNYRKQKLAGLQQKANITADLRSITGRLIQICESWCI